MTERVGPAEPRIGTQRDPSRKTIGPRVAKYSRALGDPFMPWQDHAAAVAGEINPDTGLLAFREVDILVTRQAGKTVLIRAVLSDRCISPQWGGGQTVAYTAQTRQAALRKFKRDQLTRLQRSIFEPLFEPSLSKGAEGMLFRNDSWWGIDAVKEDSGHGDSLDAAAIDEAWVHETDAVEQALSPAMITRPSAQLFVASTVGRDPARSKYLWGKVQAGRARVAAGLCRTEGIAYLEYSAAPGSDPSDPETWYATMPALGHTQSEDAVRTELAKLGPGPFSRPYLNMWPEVMKSDPVIDLAAWASRADPDVAPVGRVALALDVSPLRSHYSISAVGEDGGDTGGLVAELLVSAPMDAWVVDSIVAVWHEQHPLIVVIDGKSPANTLIEPLRAAGVDVLVTDAGDMAKACGSWQDLVTHGGLRYRPDPRLQGAVEHATKRLLEGGWALSRLHSGSDITPIVSLVLALRGFMVLSGSEDDDYDVRDSVG